MSEMELDLSVIQAQQDQDVEDAKRWASNDSGESFNAQLKVVWEFCAQNFHDQGDDLMEVVTLFALIGMRHVTLQMKGREG